jgi:beta-lactamase regulating signal transducer with metallopeptidase domain
VPSDRIATTIAPQRSRVHSRRLSLAAWQWTALVLSSIWAVAVLVLSVRLIGGRLLLVKLRRQASAADETSQWLLNECRRLMSLHRPVILGAHPAVGSPVMIGGRKPMVLVPPDWDTWRESDRHTCLLHELAHLAHRDDWAKLAQEIVLIPFFFHPLVQWLTTRLDRERELLCDETVVARGADPVAYA